MAKTGAEQQKNYGCAIISAQSQLIATNDSNDVVESNITILYCTVLYCTLLYCIAILYN